MATNLPDIEGIKKRNITEIALAFTAMTRLFEKNSKETIEEELLSFFSSLAEVTTQDQYEQRHQEFCERFVATIRAGGRKRKDGTSIEGYTPSYGQAAKVLDIATKVFVYYCGLPTPDVANTTLPFLHGAIDTPILKCLKRSKFLKEKTDVSTIKEIGDGLYHSLQGVVNAESQALGILPVQFDDVMWWGLNRSKNSSDCAGLIS